TSDKSACQRAPVAGAGARVGLVAIALISQVDAGQQLVAERAGLELGLEFGLVVQREVIDDAVMALLADEKVGACAEDRTPRQRRVGAGRGDESHRLRRRL